MSELIPNYNWDDLRKLSFKELCELPCCEILNRDGNNRPYGLFLMVPSSEYIKAICDGRGQLNNSIIPQPFVTPDDFIGIKPEVKAKKTVAVVFKDKPAKKKAKKKK